MKALTLAACLIIITASLISTCGCTSSNQTASTTPNSPSALTQDQLNTAENTMISSGYTVTQHLVANGTGADGSLYYTGQLAKNGSTYDYHIIVCNDPATADSHFSSSVSFVQQLGFSGSYLDATDWTGTMLYNGLPVGAGVIELASGAPYMVIEFFGSTSTVQPTVTPSVQPTPTPEATATPSGHNAVLEQSVSLSENNKNNLIGWKLEAWNVIWNSDNSVTMLSTSLKQEQNGTKSTWSDNETLIAFPTTQDATNYLNALDKTNYVLMSTAYNSALDTYPIALGHDPQTFQQWSTSAAATGPHTLYEITQYDNILQFLTIKAPY